MTDAAVTLFSEEGYGAVSTRRIAERAGCSETLLFRYFGDKRGLLLAVCDGLGRQDRAESDGPEPRSVQEFLEQHFLEEISNMKRSAPSLKVVIAALINDPEMTTDFARSHEHAVERVEKGLRRFQDTGAIAPSVDIKSLAAGIEQLGFAVAFFLQIIFELPQKELLAIASSAASALSMGLQPGVAQPLLEPSRRKAVAEVLGARESLDNLLEVLQDAEFAGHANGRKGARRSKA